MACAWGRMLARAGWEQVSGRCATHQERPHLQHADGLGYRQTASPVGSLLLCCSLGMLSVPAVQVQIS